jgi:predicted nucleotidyltransferase
MLFDEPFGGVLPGPRGAVLATLLRTSAPLTGRRIHALVSDRYSLWSVQEALKAWAELGIVETQTVGRATAHTINENHAAVAPLRALLDPVASLTSTVVDAVDGSVEAVLMFGSVARGEASGHSDIDLAVIAPADWEGRAALADAVRGRLGNGSDVLVFTADEFRRLAEAGEPVVTDIVRDGVALVGSKPRTKQGVN